MAIKKQEFYEGAALHQLSRDGDIKSIKYDEPFFLINDLAVLLKYSAKGRSPWGFTFTPDEQKLLKERATKRQVIIGLICGSDGVAAFGYEAYLKVSPIKKVAVHFASYRAHGQHYQVNGPEGGLDGKVPPSVWRHILKSNGGRDEA